MVGDAHLAEDSRSGAVFADVVPREGLTQDNCAVDMLVEDLK